ncbi:MAG TPA: hypothetical protein VEC36_00270 [Patescibacteria group bacterium]|nr:hypothetical protein [Patescibacteria group bacterium]
MVSTLQKLFTVDYDPALECGSLIWNNHVFSTEFRVVLEYFIEFIADRPLKRALWDTRKLVVISQTDQEWFVEIILPVLIAKGYRYGAIIVRNDNSDDLVNEVIVDSVSQYGVETRYFNNQEEAKEWLHKTL